MIVKYDLLTEYIIFVWFALLVNKYKPEFSQFKNSSKTKMRNLDNVCMRVGPIVHYKQKRCAKRLQEETARRD